MIPATPVAVAHDDTVLSRFDLAIARALHLLLRRSDDAPLRSDMDTEELERPAAGVIGTPRLR